MKRLAIFPNLEKRRCPGAVRKLVAWATEQDIAVRLPFEAQKHVREWEVELVPRLDVAEGCDLMVVLGGDGTLLAAARVAYPAGVPILGVNFGSLGFLTDVGVGQMIPTVERALRGEHAIEPRMMLRVSVLDAGGSEIERTYALNDAVVRETGGRAIEIEPRVGSASLGAFRGDGIVVCTPTGSTAYSLSAGGPVVQPTLNVLITTPICPHALSYRPVIVPAQETLEIHQRGRDTPVHLAVDGQLMLRLHEGQRVRIRRARRPIHFVQTADRSFYAVLRDKLGWGGR